MTVGVVSVLFLLSRGLHPSDIVLLKTGQTLLILVIDIPLARLVDRTGAKVPVSCAIIFGCLWLVITALSDTFVWFAVAEIFNALSLTLFSGAFTALLVNAGKTEGLSTKEIFSQYGAYQYTSMCVGVAIAFLFDSDPGSPTIWIFVSCAVGIIYISFLILVREPEIVRDVKERHVSATLSDIWSIIVTNRSLILPFLGVAFGYFVLVQFWQIALEPFNPSVQTLTLVLLTALLAQAAGSRISRLVAEFHMQSVQFAFLAIATALGAGMLFATNPLVIGVLVVTSFFAYRVFTTAQGAWIQSTSADDQRALTSAVLGTLSRSLIVILGGYTSARVGNVGIEAVFSMACIVLLSAAGGQILRMAWEYTKGIEESS